MKYYIIYKTINKINNKYYIGKHITSNINDNYLGSGKHLGRAIKKYGKENFKKEILFVFNDKEKMNDKEKELVNERTLNDKKSYNLKIGGQGGFDHIYSNPKKYKKYQIKGGKIAIKICNEKIKNDPILKLKQNNHLKKIRKNWSESEDINIKLKAKEVFNFEGRHHSEESKNKIGRANVDNHKGSKNAQYGTFWITDGLNNKKWKDELGNIPENFRKGRVM
jgi:hypothetical protein